MQKSRAISLIETLISLTIVSISLIALLPVMTLRKEANDPAKGNRYWENSIYKADSSSADVNYIKPYFNSANLNVSVGSPENAGPLKIFNKGFQNKDIVPLNVTDSLRWNGMVIDATKNIYLKSMIDKTNTGRTLYVDSNIVAIENNETATLCSYPTRCKRLSSEYVTIGNNGDEYIVADQINNVIGIGRNAARFYSTKNFIGIFNSRTAIDGDASEMNGLVGGLIIGKKDPNTIPNYGVNSNFIIYHPLNQQFNINTNVYAKSYEATSIVVSSDLRLKNIIGDYKKGLNKIIKIKPVEFTFKDDKNQKPHIGVIAQDLRKIFPEAVMANKTTGYLMVSTDPVFYALLNSIKELNAKNNDIENQNKALEEKIIKLQAIKESLKAAQGGKNAE